MDWVFLMSGNIKLTMIQYICRRRTMSTTVDPSNPVNLTAPLDLHAAQTTRNSQLSRQPELLLVSRSWKSSSRKYCYKIGIVNKSTFSFALRYLLQYATFWPVYFNTNSIQQNSACIPKNLLHACLFTTFHAFSWLPTHNTAL